MKKILYISVNSKSESESSSKTVARKLIDEVLSQCRYKVPVNKNTYKINEHENDISEASSYVKEDEENLKYDKHSSTYHENDYKENEAKEYKNNVHKHDENEKLEEDIKIHKKTYYAEDKKELKQTDKINNDKDNVELENKEKVNNNEGKTNNKEEKEYNVEVKEKHKAEVCCEDINEFIKDCCNDIHKHTHNHMHTHKHDKEECCHHNHEHRRKEECCNDIHKHDNCCEDKYHHHGSERCKDDECLNTSEWEECNEFIVEEIDLFKDYIPMLTHEFYECRNTLVGGPGPCYDKLTHVQRRDMARIKELAMQFKEADIYVIAAPMWSLLFPAPLKQYLDCVILNGVTAEINEKCCKGLLDDKERKMVFVQSVGGELPIFVKCKLDHSNAYLKDISKFLGISKYTELLVDGTGYTERDRQEAVEEAIKDIPHIAKCLIK